MVGLRYWGFPRKKRFVYTDNKSASSSPSPNICIHIILLRLSSTRLQGREYGGKGGRRLSVYGRRATRLRLTVGFRIAGIGITSARIAVFVGLVVGLGLAIVVLDLTVVMRVVIWTMPGSLGVCELSGRRGVDARDLSLLMLRRAGMPAGDRARTRRSTTGSTTASGSSRATGSLCWVSPTSTCTAGLQHNPDKERLRRSDVRHHRSQLPPGRRGRQSRGPLRQSQRR